MIFKKPKPTAALCIALCLALRAASNFFQFSGLCSPQTGAILQNAETYATEPLLLLSFFSLNPTALATLFHLSVLSRLANGLGFIVPLTASTLLYLAIFARWPLWIAGAGYPCSFGTGFWLYSLGMLLPWALICSSLYDKIRQRAPKPANPDEPTP